MRPQPKVQILSPRQSGFQNAIRLAGCANHQQSRSQNSKLANPSGTHIVQSNLPIISIVSTIAGNKARPPMRGVGR
jgi:hypothetical protein